MSMSSQCDWLSDSNKSNNNNNNNNNNKASRSIFSAMRTTVTAEMHSNTHMTSMPHMCATHDEHAVHVRYT